ncbi:MAG TPA: SIMPL domain-containing protein [Candidatus Paceibacterota bacterium]|jgi:hypothetical protein|nr:SIMPL domain-containing protein [Candidatus Paceibacterota bacterium]
MEERTAQEIIKATHWPRVMAACALGMLALFLLVLTISAVKSYHYIGTGITPTNTIQVNGEGEVVAVPDTATFTVTVQDTAPDVQTAQSKTTTQGNAIVNYLKGQGIDPSDIQTTDYEIQPQYSYEQAACPVPVVNGISSAAGIYCPPGKQTLTGYQVSETLSVKVTDTSKAGTILAGVGSQGASSVSGLTFTVSDQDALMEQAQAKAIAEAQGKAQALAKSLGVQLVGVVGFNENNGSGPVYPMAYASSGNGAAAAPAPAPEIQTGQNKITDNVTLTYEIQ